ncbi:MAG: 4-hydroxythreonine-4-phosphate dehydrogenase PdxA [Myxococcales bacterium]|nr:4-hydroxythreonine-4-phosphate dehydrogenase PdxA [Myxococcales bacterium]
MESPAHSPRAIGGKTAKIGITIGDPSGIGPEIVAKALTSLPAEQLARIVIFGEEFILDRQWDVQNTRPIQRPSTVLGGNLSPADLKPGVPNAATARAQVAYLEAALAAAKAGQIAGLATAPISKTQAMQAGFKFPGHTEFLCDGLGASAVAMMFAGPRLNVVLATVHEALATLPAVLTVESVRSAILLAANAMLEDFGFATPRIGVLGLNPHAGEEGRFGDEEARIIEPAIAAAREELSEAVVLEGPLVPDAAFRMPYDCFVAMYHDQGLIPVKLIDFDEAVNTTLGLPIVRTSPDHGVAYDIAGQGIARATSMRAAIALAFRLVDQRETRRAIVS